MVYVKLLEDSEIWKGLQHNSPIIVQTVETYSLYQTLWSECLQL